MQRKTVVPQETKKDVVKAHTPVEKTSKGLRNALFDEIELIRAGKSNPTRANAMAKLVTSVVETVRLEMEVERHIEKYKKPESPESDETRTLPTPIELTE